MRALGLTLVAVALLAGCKTKGPVVPSVVRVPVTTYVALPADLTRACDEVAKKEDTYAEAIRLANTRLASLKECNARLERIRKLQP